MGDARLYIIVIIKYLKLREREKAKKGSKVFRECLEKVFTSP